MKTTVGALAIPTLAAALLGLSIPPPVQAQGDPPSIRISGGHVYIGGQHVGSLGARRDFHGLSRIIGGHLFRTGDPRASRFGPDRSRRAAHPLRPSPPHRALPRPHHRVLPPRHHRAFPRPHHRAFHRPHRLGHRPLLWIHHPLGAVAITGHASHRSVIRTVAPPREPREVEVTPRPALPPLDAAHCADVTVHLIAGARQEMRVDVRSLGATDLDGARKALEWRLRSERRLALRDAYGGGLAVPASLVRGIGVEACEPPPEGSPTTS